ncbi:MAG TPA: hypothetical protein DHW63_05935 [Hyphomonadaceae bacterium]|nr:hypothetical protein [Hyphomonadaceae bacterium]
MNRFWREARLVIGASVAGLVVFSLMAVTQSGRDRPTIKQTIRTAPMAPHPSDYAGVQPGPRPRSPGLGAPQACEQRRDPADVALYESALPAILADARAHAHGAPVELLEAAVSADFPQVICGSVYFDAYGGMWRFVYESGRVHGRWRDLEEPLDLVFAYCRPAPRSCWLAYD